MALLITLAAALGGCGALSDGMRADSKGLLVQARAQAEATTTRDATVGPPSADGPGDPSWPAAAPVSLGAPALEIDGLLADLAVFEAGEAPRPALTLGEPVLLAQQTGPSRLAEPPLDSEIEEYDPWESFNEAMFTFNYNLDKYFLKPVAQAYDFVMPGELQRMVSNGFDNIAFVPRFVNNLLQAKWGGAGRELARFLINSVVGIGGLWDMARQEWGIEKSGEDFGQTLGKWGLGPGPYLVLPLLGPTTVRDGVGRGVDGFMDPLSYYLPFVWTRLGMKGGDILNERALNLELFEGVEATTLDLYSSVRNFYLQRRARQIRE